MSVERTLNFPDEIETLGEEFSRNSPFARKAPLKPLRHPGEVVHEQDLSLVFPTPEAVPSTPASSRLPNRSHENPAIRSDEKTRLDNPLNANGERKSGAFRKIRLNRK